MDLAANGAKPAINQLAQGFFPDNEQLRDTLPQVVTFLNKALKDHGFIVGLSKEGTQLGITIYQVVGTKP